MNARRILTALALTLAARTVAAQEPPLLGPERDSLRIEYALPPDAPRFDAPPHPDYAVMAPLPTHSNALPEVFLPRKSLPGRIAVLGNNTLRLNRRIRVELSNGQAWNWSPYPDAFLDARTLSFPMPR